MENPPTAPSPLTRRALGSTSALAILAGQFATGGSLYLLTSMGIATGTSTLLKDALHASGRESHILALIAPLLIIALILLIYGSLLTALCASLYLSFTRRNIFNTRRLMITVFTFLSISTALGLLSMRSLEATPQFHGTPLYTPTLFLWPIIFALLALAYTTLFPKPRKPRST